MCSFVFKQKTAYEIKECDWSSDVCSSDLQYNLRGLNIKEDIKILGVRTVSDALNIVL